MLVVGIFARCLLSNEIRMLLKSTDACSSAAGCDKTPVLVDKPPTTVAPMISCTCHKNENVAKIYGPQPHTDYKAAITTATNTTTTTTTTAATNTSSNTNRHNGGGSGGGSSRNFTYALVVVSLLVFLLVVCYTIWTLSIETILPVVTESVTESDKSLDDLRPSNRPPLLGSNVTGNWFSVYVEITTASSIQIENPYASKTIANFDNRRNRKRLRKIFNRRLNRKFHRRFGHQRKRAETKDRNFNSLNKRRIDDNFKEVQGDSEVQLEQSNKEKDDEVIVVKEGVEVRVEDKENLWEEYKIEHYPPKHPLVSTTSLTDLEDVRWVKCDEDERLNNLDGTGNNLVDSGDNEEERRNNLEEISGNLVEKKDNLIERRLKSIQRRRKPIKINKLNGYNLGKDFQSGKYPKNVSYAVHYKGNEKSSVHDGIYIGGESGNGSEDDNNYGIEQERDKIGLSLNINVENEENKNTVKEETNGKDKENKDDGDYDYYYEKDGEKKKEPETVFEFSVKKENKNMKSVYDRAEVEANSISPERDSRNVDLDKADDNKDTNWKSELRRLLEESNRDEERQQEVQRKSGHNKARDSCDQWIQCKYHSLRQYLKQLENLPSCPCVFPNLMWHNQLWDEQRESYFTWEIASSYTERRDIYRPGAKFCIRSLLEPGMITLAVQHCCYDVKQRLITRGRAAGTPNLISPQISWELHKKVDILPWVLCKGDWLRYHQMVPPNNAVKCEENPKDREFYNQIMDLKNI